MKTSKYGLTSLCMLVGDEALSPDIAESTTSAHFGRVAAEDLDDWSPILGYGDPRPWR